jgi:hypothetical protein
LKVKFQVKLNNSATGQIIADAVKQVAGTEYHQKLSSVNDQGSVYQIGRNSGYPYEDLVIGVGPNATPEVSMSEVYSEVYVLSWDHPGEKYLVGYTDDSIVDTVRNFRDELQKIL